MASEYSLISVKKVVHVQYSYSFESTIHKNYSAVFRNLKWRCYVTVDFETTASQNGDCITQEMCHII